MSYRFMRMLVMFDMPTETSADRRHYRQFRKMLIQNGFYMLQESIYTRMLLNPSVQRSSLEVIRKNKPPAGTVQVLTLTEKQFSSMEFISGEFHSQVLDSDERLVIL